MPNGKQANLGGSGDAVDASGDEMDANASGGDSGPTGPSGTPPPIRPRPAPTGGPGAPTSLVAGVWQSITPTGLALGNWGIIEAALDPTHPTTIYLGGGDDGGVWKSENGGMNWQLLGTPGAPVVDRTTTYLYNVYAFEVDPFDSGHVYATCGVRGGTLGFWVSTDAGASWTMPQGFADIAATTATLDVTSMAVDPTNFNHVLIASHSAWKNMGNAGILESFDGGASWTPHAPVSSWPVGTAAIHFLYKDDPVTPIGDSQTWLVVTDGNGFWRTTNAGGSWLQVSTNAGVHGGVNMYRSKTGALYTGGFAYPQRSTDNGVTWTSANNGMPFAYYQAVHGDGNLLYATPACACSGVGGSHPYFVSAEDDGLNWKPYENGEQTFGNGPFTMEFDPINRIMYTVQWAAGVWALKVK